MPRECWKLSRGLRVVTGVQGLIELGLLYVIVRSFFPHAFLRPVMVVAGALFIALCFARLQVTLDPVDAEVGITIGFWTRHVRLTQVERVEVRRLGTEIRVANGESYQFGPMPKFRFLESLLPIRSGFEGMDLAITQAAADARAADPDRAAAEDAATRRAKSRKIPAAYYLCGAGLLFLAVAAVVQPQGNGWLVHTGALLLRIYCWAGGVLAVLIGAWWLCGAWRERRISRHQGQG